MSGQDSSPTYAAMVQSLDDAVGTLLDEVDRLGIADRTVIIFTSDNGGNMYNEIDGTTPTCNAPLRGGKATMFEGGIRVPCGFSKAGLPVGLQILGDSFKEANILKVGHAYEQTTDWHLRRPAF